MQKITEVFDGVTIEGQVKFMSKQGIVIEITAPFTGFSMAGSHVPYFLMHLSGMWKSGNGELTEGGMAEARFLLLVIYRTVTIFEQHGAKLKQVYEKIHSQLDLSETLNDEQFHSEKQMLHNQMIWGDITPQEYQVQLKQIRKTNEKYHWNLRIAGDQFAEHVEKEFKLAIKPDFIEQLVQRYFRRQEDE